jgi:hypothetical protein
MPGNRHPADELADLRTERKRIEAREAELRDVLIVEDADLVGDDYRAHISEHEQHRLSYDLLVQRFGREAVNECRYICAVTTIRLEKHPRKTTRQAVTAETSKNVDAVTKIVTVTPSTVTPT